MTFTEALHTCLFKKYANFSGRASRQELWLFYLFYSVALAAPGSVAAFAFMRSGHLSDPAMAAFFYASLIVLILVAAALLLPYLGVSVRRMHDLNQSGGWAILLFIPFFSLALLFAFAFKGTMGENNYGPDPMGSSDSFLPDIPSPSPFLAKQPVIIDAPATRISNDELTLVTVVKLCLTEKYSSFTGRASRKEFWLFWLFHTIVSALAMAAMIYIVTTFSLEVNSRYYDKEDIELVARKFTLIMLIQLLIFCSLILPYLGVAVRRLHDLGKDGGLSALLVIPFPLIALPVLIYFMRRGTIGENRFGPDPLDPPPPAKPIIIGS